MWNPSECRKERGNEGGEKLSGGRAKLSKWRREGRRDACIGVGALLGGGGGGGKQKLFLDTLTSFYNYMTVVCYCTGYIESLYNGSAWPCMHQLKPKNHECNENMNSSEVAKIQSSPVIYSNKILCYFYQI